MNFLKIEFIASINIKDAPRFNIFPAIVAVVSSEYARRLNPAPHFKPQHNLPQHLIIKQETTTAMATTTTTTSTMATPETTTVIQTMPKVLGNLETLGLVPPVEPEGQTSLNHYTGPMYPTSKFNSFKINQFFFNNI